MDADAGGKCDARSMLQTRLLWCRDSERACMDGYGRLGCKDNGCGGGRGVGCVCDGVYGEGK